jgi:hypothetical protein
MQISIMVQLSRCEALLLVPDHEVCVRTYLYGAFLGKKTVQFGWIFGSQLDKALHVDAAAFQYSLGEEQWDSSFDTRETIRNLGKTVE